MFEDAETEHRVAPVVLRQDRHFGYAADDCGLRVLGRVFRAPEPSPIAPRAVDRSALVEGLVR